SLILRKGSLILRKGSLILLRIGSLILLRIGSLILLRIGSLILLRSLILRIGSLSLHIGIDGNLTWYISMSASNILSPPGPLQGSSNLFPFDVLIAPAPQGPVKKMLGCNEIKCCIALLVVVRRETFHRIAAEWRKKNEGPSPISLSNGTRLAKDEIAYCKRLYVEVDLPAKGQLGRGELTIALRKMGLDRRVPEFAEAEDGPEWFRKFCQRVGPGILWQVHYLDAAFDTYSCRTADGEEFVSPENFEKLYEALANHWSKYMPIDREKVSRKSMNAVRNAAYAAKVADETAKQFSLLNLDESSMLRIFHLYDSDKSGFLEASEIRQIAQEMKIPDYGRDHYRGFIRRNARHVDDNGDGQIEFGEFKSLLQSLVTCKVAIDWRGQGAVTIVKKQGSCGACWACWAFAAVGKELPRTIHKASASLSIGAIEGAFKTHTGRLEEFSISQLAGCTFMSSDFWELGCLGGSAEHAYGNVAATGLTPAPPHQLKGYKSVTVNDVEALKEALTFGPVSVALEADRGIFHNYKSGIVPADGCRKELNHAVLVILDRESRFVKNSWGPKWGLDGYVHVSTNTTGNPDGTRQLNSTITLCPHAGACGILKKPSLPIMNDVHNDE
ncbi:hypothetical protein FOZ61_008329, partial [Perkinsus olseni]